MNVVKEINRINDRELELGVSGASWHDDYKDSAYVFVGGLNRELTEGDVITIFSQYGEVMDVNMPREKETGKPKGFAFLMYEDQRSTVLAVDNLNGAQVAERTLRVDHVRDYKQPRSKNEEGEWVEADEQSLNAKPQMVIEDQASSSDESDAPKIDPEDPMYEYLMSKYREEKAAKKSKKKSKHKRKDETPEERRARKELKKAKKAKVKSQGMRGVEDLLKSLGGGGGPRDQLGRRDDHSRSRSPGRPSPARYDDRRRSLTPPRRTRSPEREDGRRRRSPTPDDRERGNKRYRDEDDHRDSGRDRRRDYR
ncbi:hypothetical protein BD626DRAFT_424215 [Schizophyllum amplum]|uniref:RRM domain-containing protein n=1 Tax=Schizophyllum amplum TaxID=97359 RepID=A0A550CSR1_9AGAR|nr:hypothetical protein BD626DRAFT_424215 [Auriculariopsis ampla]